MYVYLYLLIRLVSEYEYVIMRRVTICAKAIKDFNNKKNDIVVHKDTVHICIAYLTIERTYLYIITRS